MELLPAVSLGVIAGLIAMLVQAMRCMDFDNPHMPELVNPAVLGFVVGPLLGLLVLGLGRLLGRARPSP